MNSRNEFARAQARLHSDAPLSDVNLALLQRETKTNIEQSPPSNEETSLAWHAVARDFFRHVARAKAIKAKKAFRYNGSKRDR
jgi:hypothetical protein